MDRQDFEQLSQSRLFHGLREDMLRRLIGNEAPRNYPKGHLLFQQGDQADHFYFVLEGWVKLYRLMPTGEEAIMHIFTKGETFAEAAMFAGRKYPVTAEVVADARLLSINSNHFEKQISESPKIALRMLATTAERLKQLVTEVEQIKGRNSLERVAFFLLSLCPDEETSTVLDLPYEKSLIASRLNIKPESLSRVLKKLRDYGISSVKNQIIVSDVQKLRQLALEENPEYI